MKKNGTAMDKMLVREAPAAYGIRHRVSRMSMEDFDEWYSHQPELKAEWSKGRVNIHMPENSRHMGIVEMVVYLFGMYVRRRKLGNIYFEKMQIRLPYPCRREPDLFFVSKARAGIDMETFIDGPPDLVVEIVSPDDPDRDYREKFEEYEHGGVREYWLIGPLQRRLSHFALGKNGKFKSVIPRNGKYRSRVLGGFFLREEWLWNARQMDVDALLDEMKSKRLDRQQ